MTGWRRMEPEHLASFLSFYRQDLAVRGTATSVELGSFEWRALLHTTWISG